MKSAACWALLDAVKMARLSAFSTRNHDAMYVLRVIGTGFTAESQMRHRESSRQFGYQFLNAVSAIAEALPQFPVTAICLSGPVPGFMCPRAVVIRRREERCKRR